jgi:hypothetical protein
MLIHSEEGNVDPLRRREFWGKDGIPKSEISHDYLTTIDLLAKRIDANPPQACNI